MTSLAREPSPSRETRSDEAEPDEEVAKLRATELREFLTQVGHFMDLPPKKPTRLALTAIAEPAPRSVAARMLPIVAVALIVVALGGAVWTRRQSPMPAALIGEWMTSHPRYADRHLAFSDTAVLLGAGGTAPIVSHRITKLRTAARGDTILVTLTYDEGGEQAELHAALIDGEPARLLFERPTGLVWRRRTTAISRGGG